jgi:hypothetical protein
VRYPQITVHSSNVGRLVKGEGRTLESVRFIMMLGRKISRKEKKKENIDKDGGYGRWGGKWEGKTGRAVRKEGRKGSAKGRQGEGGI